MTSLPSVLLIDDEKRSRTIFHECLEEEVEQHLIEVETAGDATKGLNIIEHKIKQGIPVLPFIDIILPGISGLDLIEEINSREIKPTSIVISAHKKLSELEEIKNKYDWLNDCLRKPFGEDVVRQKIKEIFNISISPITQFDYHGLDQETVSLLVEETEKIKSIMKRTVADIIDIGGSLYKIKSKLDHGQFQLWVEKELLLEHTTALNFMRVWDTFGERKEEICQMGLSISVLYLLASRNSPQEFRDEVLRRAKVGNPIPHAEAKQLKKFFLERNQIQGQKTDAQDDLSNKDNTITIDVTPSRNTEDISDDKNIVTQISPNQKQRSKIQAKPQEVIKVVRSQNLWELGENILYCGFPNSPQFKDLLKPLTISLNIGFPNFSNWTQEDLFPIISKSTLVYNSLTSYPYEQLTTLLTMLQSSIELSTKEKDRILFSFLPNPEILLLIDKLLCKCIIAEPDPKKVKAIISLWKKYEVDRSFPFYDSQFQR